MKHFYALTIGLLATSLSIQAQKTTTWNGNGGGSWTTIGNWSNGVPADNDTVIFDSGNSEDITNVPTRSLRVLRIENGTTVRFTVTGDRTITLTGNGNATRLVIEANSTLELVGSTNNDLDLFVTRQQGIGSNGTSSANIAGTLVLGTNATADLNNNNTNVTVTGAIEVTANDASVAGATGTLNFSGNGVYRHQRNGGSIPTATWSATSTLEVLGSTSDIPTIATFAQSFGNVVWNTPGLTNGTRSLAANLATINGNFTMNSTGAGAIALKNGGGTTNITTVAGNFTLTGGNLFIIGSSETQELRVAGNVSLLGGTLSKGGNNSTGRFIFNGNTIQQLNRPTNGTTISGDVDFTINGGARVDFGTSIITTTGTFTVSNNAWVAVDNAEGIMDNNTSGAIRANNRSYSSGANYEFRGASTGNFSTGFGNQVSRLIINNASGEVTMARNFNVTNSLDLLNGYLTPGTNTLTVENGATSTSQNDAFVNGKMNKVAGANTGFTFYVGKAGAGLRAVSIRTAGGGGGTPTFQAEFLPQNASTVSTTLGAGIAKVSQCEYWTVNRTGGTRSATVTLSWSPASACNGVSYVTNLPTLRVARFNGTSWVNEGGTLGNDASTATGTITSGNITNFSPFALATTSLTDNPLPVLFDGVKAFGKGTGVQIEWSNLTERDIVRYQVERSTNGVDFYAVNEQAPKSNRDDKASYSHLDASPVNGTNYYRIRVEEVGGKSIYSKILRVEMGTTKAAFSLYPNPVTEKQFTVSLGGLQQGKYILEVFSTNGQRVYQSTINNVGAGVTQMVELPASIQKGMYVAVVTGDGFRDSKQVIIK